MELVWYRMLAPIMGGNVYTFGIILSVVLAGIGVGGAAYAIAARRWRPDAGALALSIAVEALFVAVPYALGDRLAVFAAVIGEFQELRLWRSRLCLDFRGRDRRVSGSRCQRVSVSAAGGASGRWCPAGRQAGRPGAGLEHAGSNRGLAGRRLRTLAVALSARGLALGGGLARSGEFAAGRGSLLAGGGGRSAAIRRGVSG